MRWFYKLSLRFRSLFRKSRVEQELSDELRFHLEKMISEKVEKGMKPEQARYAALRELGGVEEIKEECRDTRRANYIENLAQDIRYSLRQLRRSPGFTAVAVITLAIGIGANTAIFSVVNAVLLRPLPYKDPDRLVVVLHNGRYPVAPANFIDWRSENHVFDRMGAAEAWGPNLTEVDRPEPLAAMHVTADILPMLRVPPILGRFFLPEEDAPGNEHEVVLSYGLWQRRFAGDSKIIGHSMTLDGNKYTVIGVMPRGFQFALFWVRNAELWAPLALGSRAANRGGNSLRIFARLKSGIPLEQARAEMTTITAHLETEYPGTNRNVIVLPFKEKVVGDIRPAFLILLGAVCFVLLIACANVAHMLLARAAVRHKEIVIRSALGAGRARMVRQLLTESLLLAMVGGGAGLLLARFGASTFSQPSAPPACRAWKRSQSIAGC